MAPVRDSVSKLIEGVEDAQTSVGADGIDIISIPSEALHSLARKAREAGYDVLHCLSGVDFPDRIEVVYHLYKFRTDDAVVLKARCGRDDGSVDSVVDIWVTADWHERETAEMFGVTFSGHPNPERLLMADDFPGFPLRRDWSHDPDELERYLLR